MSLLKVENLSAGYGKVDVLFGISFSLLAGKSLGIVGPNGVGKSTLFNALTNSSKAQAANFPFCTIEPNVGIVEVPDQRISKLENIVSPEKTQPATVELVDIAGLVAGASKGEGLGNKFLANIRETDAIMHVVRCLDDENIVHVSGHINPLSDIETINTELILLSSSNLIFSENKINNPIAIGVLDFRY